MSFGKRLRASSSIFKKRFLRGRSKPTRQLRLTGPMQSCEVAPVLPVLLSSPYMQGEAELPQAVGKNIWGRLCLLLNPSFF